MYVKGHLQKVGDEEQSHGKMARDVLSSKLLAMLSNTITTLNRRRSLILLPFVILGLLVYSNTLDVPFHFDDEANIEQNPHIRVTEFSVSNLVNAGAKSLASNRPIANISFALNYYFHGYRVTGYHVVNIIIHVLTGIFLYLFTKTTLCISWRKQAQFLNSFRQNNGGSSARQKDGGSSTIPRFLNPSMISFFAALLWLVHPIQTQSVTYIVQRMNSMAAMFYVLSFLFYVKGRLVEKNQRRWPWFAGCALAGILAIGSKEIAATLPFFILLYEWYFFQDLSKAWLKRHLPYIVGTLILFGLLGFLYLGTNPLHAILSGYRHRDFTLAQRVLTEFRVVIHYIGLLVYPHPSRLNLDYDFPLSHSLTEPITTLLSIGAVIGLIALAIWVARKERLISFCILWFFGNLAMESSVIGLEIVYEHRVYLPSMFFFLPVLVVACRRIRRDWAVAVVLGCVISLLSLWTYERNSIWKEPTALWKDCVEKSAGKARPHNNLGLALYGQGRLDEAVAQYLQALRINPRYPQAHNNLGAALAAKGAFDDAISYYCQALRIRPNDPETHNNWGAALHRQGKLEEAIVHYSEALRIKPSFAEGHNNLGLVLAEQGRLGEAIAHFSKALRFEPAYAEAYNNLGTALHRQGRLDEAIAHYSAALRIDPDHVEARRNLGIAMRGIRNADDALNSIGR